MMPYSMQDIIEESSTTKMNSACSFETFINVYQSTQHYIDVILLTPSELLLMNPIHVPRISDTLHITNFFVFNAPPLPAEIK
jgi:hypothetical protein